MGVKPLFRLAVASFMLASCQSESFHINGYARQLADGDTVYLIKVSQPEVIIRSAIVNEGRFAIFGTTSDSPAFCKAYLKRTPACSVEFFLETGEITIELNPPPLQSRVSGTPMNIEWQQLNDSIRIMGQEMINIARQARKPGLTPHLSQLKAVDSLHRKMSECIYNTARRNKDNAVGHYIQENYKEPAFK